MTSQMANMSAREVTAAFTVASARQACPIFQFCSIVNRHGLARRSTSAYP